MNNWMNRVRNLVSIVNGKVYNLSDSLIYVFFPSLKKV